MTKANSDKIMIIFLTFLLTCMFIAGFITSCENYTRSQEEGRTEKELLQEEMKEILEKEDLSQKEIYDTILAYEEKEDEIDNNLYKKRRHTLIYCVVTGSAILLNIISIILRIIMLLD